MNMFDSYRQCIGRQCCVRFAISGKGGPFRVFILSWVANLMYRIAACFHSLLAEDSRGLRGVFAVHSLPY